MRKAFDANVPKLKPRLKAGAPAAVAEASAELPLEPAVAPVAEVATPVATATPAAPPTPKPAPSSTPAAASPRSRAPVQDEVQVQVRQETGGDVLSRRERLEKIKRKVAEAARPQPRIHPVPADPARAAESVLGLVRDLEAELVRAREREEAVRALLDEQRSAPGRASAEAFDG